MDVAQTSNVLLLHLVAKRKRAFHDAHLRIKRAQRRRETFRRHQSQQRMLFALSLCMCAVQLLVPCRAAWARTRSTEWWDRIVSGFFTSQDWLINFRMSQATFNYICTELRNEIERNDTVMRNSIPVQVRVAITLWFLATNADYSTIGHLFGISKASVCQIRKDVCRAIVKVLLPKYVKIPTGRVLSTVIKGFEKRGFPQCGGALDGSHIPIEVPQDSPSDYHNRKGWHSVILQALVDDVGNFTDICVGWPGKVHDARVLQNSQLYAKGERGHLFEERTTIINATRVPVCVLGDPAYPLQPWLMKPFVNTGCLTDQQRHFNYRLSKARVIVEQAFGRLKGRWRCLRTKLSVQVEDVPDVVGACCVLHNICQTLGDAFDEHWLESSQEPQDSLPALATPPVVTSTDASNIRRAIMLHFSNK